MNKLICSFSGKTYNEIILSGDVLGICFIIEPRDISYVIPKLISLSSFNEHNKEVIDDILLYIDFVSDISTFDIPLNLSPNYNNFSVGFLPVYIDEIHWKNANEHIKSLNIIEQYKDYPYKVLVYSLKNLQNKSEKTESDDKFTVKLILSTCSKLFMQNSSDWKKQFNDTYDKYTLHPILRLPSHINDNCVFIGQIISGLNSEYLQPMINIHAEQFLSYMEEEEARRNLSTKIKEMTDIEIDDIIKYILNIDHIKEKMIGDIEFNIKNNIESLISNFNIKDQSDVFNNQDNKLTKFISYAVPFIMERGTYNSYNGVKRIASYISNLIYRNEEVKKNDIKKDKYKEVLFSYVSSLNFLEKTILRLI